MKLTLNVYKGAKVVKTYEVEEFVLPTGVCEDILQVVDVDKFATLISNPAKADRLALGMEIVKIVSKSYSKFRPFFLTLFEGMTEEEYRNTSTKELGDCIVKIIQYSVGELANIGQDSKN